MSPADITDCREVPVTTPIRTLVDLGTVLTRNQLEAAVNEADKLDLVHAARLPEELRGFRGQPGVAALRRMVESAAFALTDSELERRFLRIVGRAGLPTPATQFSVNGFRADFFWPDLGLVVETDGLRYHRTPLQQARDRRRDQTHAAAGLITLRFTHSQVRHEPEHVAATLKDVIAGLRPRL